MGLTMVPFFARLAGFFRDRTALLLNVTAHLWQRYGRSADPSLAVWPTVKRRQLRRIPTGSHRDGASAKLVSGYLQIGTGPSAFAARMLRGLVVF